MPPEIDLFAANHGSVTAPAGCGKTHVIAENIAPHVGSKPILVLTHTNAGASALRGRLHLARVPRSAYRVSTIDGLALQVIGMFPSRSGHNPRLLEIATPEDDYPAIRQVAADLLRAGHINDVVRASYARLIVDEYQDCTVFQHEIVRALSAELPTALLGDPLQGIFRFAGPLVDWNADVVPTFPSLGVLATPWRWRNAGTEDLGQWLLQARAALEAGQAVDLRGAPNQVRWVNIRNGDATQLRRVAAQTRPVAPEESVLIIGDARNARGRCHFTSHTPGATVVETVGLEDLVNFARGFALDDPNALTRLVEFASTLMTQVGSASLLQRVQTITRGRPRTPPTPAENAAVAFVIGPSFPAALTLLEVLEQQANARAFRPDMLHCLKASMRVVIGGRTTLIDEVLRTRERRRHHARPMARRAVGSTLLLKGLEADVAIVLHPELMDVQNLYVALTRGARRLIVCSATPLLQPA